MTESKGPEKPTSSSAQFAAAERAAFEPTAENLASLVAPDLVPFSPSGPALSAQARWFRDLADQRLIVVVCAHETVDVTDDILAFALAWQRDRDLVLVLPETHCGLTLNRLPWIDTPVRVFTYGDGGEPLPAIIPSRSEVLAGAMCLPLHSTAVHDLKDRAYLVSSLVRHLDRHWALVSAHRSSYLAWHCLGRQVVRIARSGKGVRIQAGVAYSKPSPDKAVALVLTVRQELSPVQTAEVEHRVAEAIWKRFAGDEQGHVEHRMQAALAAAGLTELGFTNLSREYPAWRGVDRPGYIDFLALDQHNALHVVETKVGTADVKGVLQTLDYATWVTAHAEEIRSDRGWPSASHSGSEKVTLDFVLAPNGDGRAIGPYLAGQLEALSGGVPWRIAIVADPLAEVPKLTGPWYRAVPLTGSLVATPVQGPRWVGRIGHEFAGQAP